MKATIAGVRYNTDTAQMIGKADNLARGADSITSHSYWTAELYKTPRSGRYFLAGRGGPMSMFRRPAGQSSWSGGERIVPLSDEDAQTWAENHLDPDIVNQHFSTED